MLNVAKGKNGTQELNVSQDKNTESANNKKDVFKNCSDLSRFLWETPLNI